MEVIETAKGQSCIFIENSSLVKKAPEVDNVKHSIFADTAAPYLQDNCELIIPLDCKEKWRWWAGGQSIFETLIELAAPYSVFEKYIGSVTSSFTWRQLQEIRKNNNKTG